MFLGKLFYETNKKSYGKKKDKADNKETGKPSETIQTIIGMIMLGAIVFVVGFLSVKLITGSFNYVSNMDFPSINIFGESENDKKIKQLESKIKELERKSDNSKSIVDAIKNLEMQIITLDD